MSTALLERADPGRASDQCAAPLKIALFSGNYNYVQDGANRALNLLVSYLEESEGATVRVYSPTTDKPAFAPAGTLISVPSFSIPGRSEYRVAMGLPKAICKDIAAFDPDIFHLSAPDWLGQAAMRFARKMNRPVATSMHTSFETYLEFYGFGWLRPWAERYLAKFYANSDVVLAPSPVMVEMLKNQGLGDRAKLWGRGVDTRKFNPSQRSLEWRRSLGIADDDVAVLFFGRLVKEKGLAEYGAMISEARKLGLRVKPLVIGDGPARSELEKILPDAIFAGHLAGESLGRAVASADILINPSISESFGNVTLEAMASKLAIICANVPASRFLIQDRYSGLLCKMSRTDEATYALKTLVESPEMRARLSENAYRQAQKHSWHRAMANVSDAYQMLMNQRSTIGF